MEEKSMYINHNGMATNVANTLTSHYSNLSTSTQRLSSGMRINSAADDAAGLAISELMRADIAALNQGVRNANDAISLIQTADGALGVIDEKLIRMKELAEQASTGTYDSTQRLMIDSEYQQMASEITRIANATDFNGVKLLDGSLSGVHNGSGLESKGEMKVHFGTANDSAEDYYYISIGEATAAAFGLGNSSNITDDRSRIVKDFAAELGKQLRGWDKGTGDQQQDYGKIQAIVDDFAAQLGATTVANFVTEYKNGLTDEELAIVNAGLPKSFLDDQGNLKTDLTAKQTEQLEYAAMRLAVYRMGNDADFADGATGIGGNDMGAIAGVYNNNELASRTQAAMNSVASKLDSKYNYGGQSIQTQEDAQLALDAIQGAIVEKDKIRAHLGATQNRLENTVTNLTIQSENLQNAESRIRDVDVATEMTNFVRNQVLTQSAVAMLSQANSLPQMAQQLIG